MTADIVLRCWICQKPIGDGWRCDDCAVKMTAPITDDEVIEHDDPDGEALWRYHREQEERKEPVDYQELRRHGR